MRVKPPWEVALGERSDVHAETEKAEEVIVEAHEMTLSWVEGPVLGCYSTARTSLWLETRVRQPRALHSCRAWHDSACR